MIYGIVLALHVHIIPLFTYQFTILFQAELLGKKYEEKYKQVAEIASKLTIEEAAFREIQVISHCILYKRFLSRELLNCQEGSYVVTTVVLMDSKK